MPQTTEPQVKPEAAAVANTESGTASNGENAQPKKRESMKALIDKGIVPPVEAKTGEVNAQPQKAGEAAEGDTFLTPGSGIDPQKLPAELKTIYNSMLSDYKEKTRQVSEMRGTVTKEMKDKAIEEALSGLNQEQFRTLANHPVFVRELVSYLQQQGVTTNGQNPEKEEVDTSLMTDTERVLYERLQKIEGDNKNLQSKLNNLDLGSKRATIEAQDANLHAKYQGVYKPESVNRFLDLVLSGQRQLTREDIFKVEDYDQAVRRAYDWGRRDSYDGSPEKERASFLSGVSGGGEGSYEIPKRQPKESMSDYMLRLSRNAKEQLAQGKVSPYISKGIPQSRE